MELLVTVEEFVNRHYSGFDWDLSPESVDGNNQLLCKWIAHCGVEPVGLPYARYDTTLARLVAAGFAMDVGARGLGFTARLTNCGMSAITLALRAAGTHIVSGDVLYGLTKDELNELDQAYGSKVKWVRNSTTVDIMAHVALLRSLDPNRRIGIFVETIGNGLGMPVADVEELLRSFWSSKNTIVIVDNTFATCALVNPFHILKRLRKELGGECFTFVYVESASKYYRANPAVDKDTLGIIIAPDTFLREEIDPRLVRGAAVPLSVLRKFPVELFMACSRVTPILSTNAVVAAHFLRGHPQVRQVWYPHDHPMLAKGAGGVLYLERDTDNRGEGAEVFGSVIPKRASFGHVYATHIDWGAFDESSPAGLTRLAVGTLDTPESTLYKLRKCLGPR